MPQQNYVAKGKILLKEWIVNEGISISAAARAMELPTSIMWRWLKGPRLPQIKNAKLIEKLTKGYVPIGSWAELSLIEPGKSPQNHNKKRYAKKTRT